TTGHHQRRGTVRPRQPPDGLSRRDRLYAHGWVQAVLLTSTSFFRSRPAGIVPHHRRMMSAAIASDPTSTPSLIPLPHRHEMERAYRRSDASYDGVLYIAVRTTGIFCRPSCHARKPKPENVEFFASPKDAMVGGYRACLKCKPVAGDDEPAWVKTLLDRIDADPAARMTERDLRSAGLEPERVRRYFAARYGLTFQ